MAIRQYGATVIETAAESSEELAFLAAIHEDQHDDTPKLVYADWLEERGDARGPFLRDFVRQARDPNAPLPLGEEFPLVWSNVVGLRPLGLIRQLILDGSISGSHVHEVEYELMSRLRPILFLDTSPAEDADFPPGSTKFGGRPDLPAGVEWPVYPWPKVASPTEVGVGVFCAQIRLSDLRDCVAARELPAEGLLSFFNPIPFDGPSVFLYPEEGPYHRPDPPARTRTENSFRDCFYPLPARRLRVIEGVDLPDSIGEEYPWPEDFWQENADAFHQMREWLEVPEIPRTILMHELLGNGAGYTTGPEPDGMRRLASFGSLDDQEHYWGDSNVPIWRISEEDLPARRFHNAFVYGG